jgi:hypothetical protein
MKRTILLLFAFAALNASAQRLTTSDPNYQQLYQLTQSIGWYQMSDSHAWSVGDNDVDVKTGARCMEALNALRAAGVPATRTIEVQWESPEFKPGVHSLAEIRTSCEHAEKVGRIRAFEKWAILAMQAGSNVRSGSSYYKLCVQTYNDIVKAGVSPGDKVPERMIAGVSWSGTIEDLRKKWCDAGIAQATSQNAAHEAPFREAMAGDKLRIALKYGSVFLPGGAGTANAQKMAAASLWFLDLSPPRHCANGLQVHTIRRYHFTGDHLAGTSEKDYCGRAPASAFQ